MLHDWRKNERKQLVIERNGHRLSERGFKLEVAIPPPRAFGMQIDDPDFIWNNPDGLLPHEAAAKLRESRAQKGVSKVTGASPDIGKTTTAGKEPAGAGEDALSEFDDVESEEKETEEEAAREKPIDHLIVTVKAQLTVSALSAVKHRLHNESTICLLQNGMGVVEELNKHVFPDPSTRPNYMLGIVSHGVNSPQGADPFFAIHAGKGTIALAVLPRQSRDDNNDGRLRSPEVDISTPAPYTISSRHLMRTLQRTPVLGAIGVPAAEFLQQKLEKLAANAVINPLTAMLDSRNGTLAGNFAITRVMRLLLAEISLVLRSLPELQGLPNVPARFSAERLETLVVGIANRTGNNISSMLSDIRNRRQTEVKYINGYLVRRGEELGIATVCNYMVLQMVLGKSKMVQDEARALFSEGVPADSPGKG